MRKGNRNKDQTRNVPEDFNDLCYFYCGVYRLTNAMKDISQVSSWLHFQTIFNIVYWLRDNFRYPIILLTSFIVYVFEWGLNGKGIFSIKKFLGNFNANLCKFIMKKINMTPRLFEMHPRKNNFLNWKRVYKMFLKWQIWYPGNTLKIHQLLSKVNNKFLYNNFHATNLTHWKSYTYLIHWVCGKRAKSRVVRLNS